jgi:ELWxxDGT repeat protein
MRFTIAGNYLFFIAGTRYDAVNATNENVELWRTDGTSRGTYQVRDIFRFNYGSSKPSQLRAVNNKLVFFAYTEDHGREIWTSNGFGSATYLLRDINTLKGPGTSYGQGSESRYYSFGTYEFA